MELAKVLKAVEDKLNAMDVEMQIWEQALTVTLTESQAAVEKTRANLDWDDRVTIEADRLAMDNDLIASMAYSAIRHISVNVSSSLRNFSCGRSELVAKREAKPVEEHA